jgi:hypothetical protein
MFQSVLDEMELFRQFIRLFTNQKSMKSLLKSSKVNSKINLKM